MLVYLQIKKKMKTLLESADKIIWQDTTQTYNGVYATIGEIQFGDIFYVYGDVRYEKDGNPIVQHMLWIKDAPFTVYEERMKELLANETVWAVEKRNRTYATVRK